MLQFTKFGWFHIFYYTFHYIASQQSQAQQMPSDTVLKMRNTPTSHMINVGRDLEVEIGVFVDYEMWNRFYQGYGPQTETKLQDFVSTVFANIQILYKHPTMTYNMSFKIVDYEVLKSQPESLMGNNHQNGDAEMYLDAFCMYQYKLETRKWDQSVLVTGYDLHRNGGTDNSIRGLGRVDGVCDPFNSCVIMEGHDFSSVFVTAHELGHGFGMVHDDLTCGSGFIMSGLSLPGQVTWSKCSIQALAKYMKHLDDTGENCLRVSSGNEVLPLDSFHLPGQKYSGDLQCGYMYGQPYQQTFAPNDSPEGSCWMLQCRKTTFSKLLKAHPALEGTYCGDRKYCIRGQCTGWSGAVLAEIPRPVDGGWSEWSSAKCSSCSCPSIPGTVGIVVSNRTCTKPRSKNGGNACKGSSKRGFICRSHCLGNGETLKMYIKRKCQWRRTLSPDDNLSGNGVQLLRNEKRACKIFCSLNSQYPWFRFYGDFIPDGTPCGKGKYCVNGACLAVKCGNTALVDEEDTCPEETEVCGRILQTKPVRLFPTVALNVSSIKV